MTDQASQVQADQIAHTVADLLDPRLSRLERAILGDDVGNPGLVRRIHTVEEAHRGVDKIHDSMRTSSEASVSRVEKMLDTKADRLKHEAIADQVAAKADRHEVEDLAEQLRRLSTRIDRMVWLFLGAGIASGGGAAAIARIVGGP